MVYIVIFTLLVKQLLLCNWCNNKLIVFVTITAIIICTHTTKASGELLLTAQTVIVRRGY